MPRVRGREWRGRCVAIRQSHREEAFVLSLPGHEVPSFALPFLLAFPISSVALDLEELEKALRLGKNWETISKKESDYGGKWPQFTLLFESTKADEYSGYHGDDRLSVLVTNYGKDHSFTIRKGGP
ncbi:MAG: hypothetical protein AAGJ79_13855 [Verrucomicrobiota bacterium]